MWFSESGPSFLELRTHYVTLPPSSSFSPLKAPKKFGNARVGMSLFRYVRNRRKKENSFSTLRCHLFAFFPFVISPLFFFEPGMGNTFEMRIRRPRRFAFPFSSLEEWCIVEISPLFLLAAGFVIKSFAYFFQSIFALWKYFFLGYYEHRSYI